MRPSLYHVPTLSESAGRYSSWCNLVAAAHPPELHEGYALWLDREGLALINATLPGAFRLTSQIFSARLSGQSLLARACSGGGQNLTILDPFAGFGLDGLLLAHLDHRLTFVEKHPAIWLLLTEFAEDLGLEVAAHCDDAMRFMQETTESWDVVFLDPMFPARRKKALPNLGLQHLRSLAGGEDIDLPACLDLAKQRANLRVVFKRRLKDPIIGKPSHQLKGQAVRFDVYV